MTPRQIYLVRQSFALVAAQAAQAAARLFQHLSKAGLAVAPLFKGNLQDQGQRLMNLLGAVVALLDKPEQLLPALHQLGGQQAARGVLADDCDAAATALLRTVAESLGEAFDEEICDAWCELIDLVSRTLLVTAPQAPQRLAA